MTNIDLLYNPAAAQKHFGQNYFSDRKLHFRIVERGTVLPYKQLFVNGKWTWGVGGVVDERGEFIKNTFVYEGAGEAYTPLEEPTYSPKTAIYLGMFFPVWGHCLTDNIRRLWFLKSEPFNHYFRDCPIVYAPWERDSLPFEQQKNFRRLLEILDVDVERLWKITQPVQFENVIIPDESFFLVGGQRKFTAEYRETIDRVRNFALKNRTPSAAKKIYFLYGRRQFGEERLAEYFRAKDYEIVQPERLTVDDQLNLLINAESFAATLGSCSHNSIFLRDGAEVILIPRAAERFTDYQQTLDQLHPLNVNYVDSSMSIFETEHGFYCFVISRQLKNFFGDRFDGYSDDDFASFLKCAKYLLGQGCGVDAAAGDYYGEVLTDFMTRLKQRGDLMTTYGVNLS